MRHVLITGCAGFVGTMTTKLLLDSGYKVRGMDNGSRGHTDSIIPFMDHPNFEFQLGDVTKTKDCEKAFKNIDVVIALAAIVGFPACARNPAYSRIVNVDGMKNIIDQHVKNNTKLIFASTGSVFGKVEGVCTEETPTNPQSEYGIQKLEAENLVSQTDNSISFRFATGYGCSYQHRVNLLVNDLVLQAVKNRTFTIFEGSAYRTFIHVRDMARVFKLGIETLIENESHYKVYNAGSDESNMTKKELAEYICSKTGCIPFFGDTGVDLDQRDYKVDYSKIKELGFSPSYTLQQGIDELIRISPLIQGIHRYE